MKIDHLQPQQVLPQQPAMKQSPQDAKKFEEMLTEFPVEKGKKGPTVASWIQAIDQLKQNLEMEMTPENLKNYKDSVRDFLTYYLSHEVQVKERFVRDERMYLKSVRIIHVMDEKLDRLTDKLLDSQLGRLEVLKKTGEIQGLLLDLTV